MPSLGLSYDREAAVVVAHSCALTGCPSLAAKDCRAISYDMVFNSRAARGFAPPAAIFWLFKELGRMGKSLLEQLPAIVADGKREAERIMERLESSHRLNLQTRELVIPSKDTNWQSLFRKIEKGEQDLTPATMNRLVYGDNLLAMAALLAGDDENPSLRGKVDLIYIDPPFDSKADYRTKVILRGADIEQKPTAIEQFAYSDTWQDGTASYLRRMAPNFVLMRELLSNKGSFFVHLDWHVGHYVKIVLDEIFGKDNFLNHITWLRSSSGKTISRNLPSDTDMIFWYSKTDEYHFNPVYKPLSESTKAMYNRNDNDGRGIYRFYPLQKTGGPGPETTYDYIDNTGKVWKCPSKGWRMKYEKLKALENDGRLYLEGNTLQEKAYWNERDNEGRLANNLWDDIHNLQGNNKEILDYPTQKPEKLLERIVTIATTKDSVVADFFVGSGTTAAVAERLGRRWIATDLGKPACMVTRKRLIDMDAKPFLYQHVGDYQVEMARSTMGRRFRVGDLSEIVLGLYGALLLVPEENPSRNLGRITHHKTLVYVDSPNKMTGLATLKKALELRNNHMGGWDKVVILGWNFDPGIVHDIQGLNEGDRLEVLVIPPDLLDRLKKKGNKLKADEVRFSSLQYLVLGDVTREQAGDKEKITVALENYVLLSPEALNLDEDNREKLQKVINNDPLALIEYWSVDPDYDGEVFRSVWQDYRGNTENDDDPYRVIPQAELTDLPAKPGPRRICVRAVDVFGFEAEAIIESLAVSASADNSKRAKAA